MASYNVNFELSVEDVDLIESALRLTKQELCNGMIGADLTATGDDADPKEHDETLKQIQDLLGRMHNQKIFYRPRTGAYIGG